MAETSRDLMRAEVRHLLGLFCPQKTHASGAKKPCRDFKKRERKRIEKN
jgi:hypothetical protein